MNWRMTALMLRCCVSANASSAVRCARVTVIISATTLRPRGFGLGRLFDGDGSSRGDAMHASLRPARPRGFYKPR